MNKKEQAIAIYLECLHHNGLDEAQFSCLPANLQEMLEQKDGKYFLSPYWRRRFRVVLTGGVFDVIHPGHIHTLREASKFGDVLIVAVARDEFVKKKKGRLPLHPVEERAKTVGSLRIVDLALIGAERWQDTLHKVGPNIVVFGYDQKKMHIRGIKTVQLKSQIGHPNSKTGIIRKKLGI